jgi:hypothetical protein
MTTITCHRLIVIPQGSNPVALTHSHEPILITFGKEYHNNPNITIKISGPPITTNSPTLKKATAMLAEASENLQSTTKSNPPERLSNVCFKRKCFLNWYYSHQLRTKILTGCMLVPRIKDYSEPSHIQMAQKITVELFVPQKTA